MIMRRVRSHGRGWVFAPRDFLDLAPRATVDQALKRLSVRELRRDPETEGHLELRRVGFGLYDYPRWDLDGSAPLPGPDAVAAALKRRDGHRVTKSGAHHAHDLGLTELGAGAAVVLLTDGQSRTFRLAGRLLELRHEGPATMAWAERPGGPVVLALSWLGPQLIEPAKEHLRRRGLSKAAVEDLRANIKMAPAYMQPAIRELVGRKRKRGKSPGPPTEGQGRAGGSPRKSR